MVYKQRKSKSTVLCICKEDWMEMFVELKSTLISLYQISCLNDFYMMHVDLNDLKNAIQYVYFVLWSWSSNVFNDFITKNSFRKIHKGNMCGFNDSILPNIIYN